MGAKLVVACFERRLEGHDIDWNHHRIDLVRSLDLNILAWMV